MSKAANQALGREPNPLFRTPGSRRSGSKIDMMYSSGQSSMSVADIIGGKIDADEKDEMKIYSLEKQLDSVKDQLGQAKFKYEKRQLYELNRKE